MESPEAKKENANMNPLVGLNVPKDPLEFVSSVFASRKPKHALQGFTDGAQNIAVGVGMGLGSFVAMPLAGRSEGFSGVLKGLGLGAASFVGITTYGAVTGVRQIGRGLWNTPTAVKETMDGFRFWDSTEGQWVCVDLAAAFADLPITDTDIMTQARELYREACKENVTTASTAENEETSNSTEKNYYTLLDLPKTATAAEIRAAFHRKALEMHPDKNPNDPQATVRFQQLLEANNVLSNEDRRMQYDAAGKVDAASCQNESFSQVENGFGAEFLHPFIGRVTWAIYFIPNVLFNEKLQKELQRRRILRIAQWLTRFIDDEGNLDGATVFVRDAVLTRAGPKLMTIVAQQYARAARQHLHEVVWKRELDSFLSTKKAEASHAADACSLAFKSAVKTLSADDAFDLLVTLCEPDIRGTVLRACRYLLYDTSVSEDTRRTRANNLLKLSDLMMNEIINAKNEAESDSTTETSQ